MPPGRRPRSSSFCDSTQDHSYAADDALDIAHLVTSNGRVHREALNCRPTKVRLVQEPAHDEFSAWIPVDSDRNYPHNDYGAPLRDEHGVPLDELEDEDDEMQNSGKRKRYPSDDPLGAWKPMIPMFMREMYRHDGVGVTGNLECLTCHAQFSPTCRLFKCEACCVSLECGPCMVARNQCNPLHIIKEWTGKFWDAASLSEIGLVYQLGHNGLSCRLPNPLIRNMVVITTQGIHQIRLRYCNCQPFNPASNLEQLLRNKWFPATVTDPATCASFEVLDMFRLLSVVGNVTAYDFVTTLERLTSGADTNSVLDRYSAFGRMAREYGFLLRFRRCGTLDLQLQEQDFNLACGQLTMDCWACPIEGKNLPKGWQDVDPKHMYLYTLILAIDANFRLKNRLRTNKRSDPPLASGAGYFVDLEPYKEYLRNYVSEKDISACMAFAALQQRDTKATKGLRISGVVACACSRHEIIRPNGIGDLQKGERYTNVDWVLFSAIQGLKLRRYAMSYNIICHYKKNIWDRMFRLPPQLHLNLQDVEVIFGLPTWHAIVHDRVCRAENALVYQPGVGRTDGEGIERIWSSLNPAAYSTKEMSEGGRADALEDRIDHLTFHKNMGLGDLLRKRYIVASKQYDLQRKNFEDINSSLDKATSREWSLLIDQWNENRSENPNPYVLEEAQSIKSREAEIRLELAAEEAKLALTGTAPVHDTSPMGFITAGLKLEEAQHKLRFDIKHSSSMGLVAEEKIQQRRTAILQKVKKLRDMQRIYVPGAIRAEEASTTSATTLPEKLSLYLPSDFTPEKRLTACESGLADIERRLREGQCTDAISEVRRHLRSKHHLILFRNANVVGQVQATRSRTLIDSVSNQVFFSAEKYRRARVSLELLGGDLKKYPYLSDDDLTLDSCFDEDAVAVQKLAAANHRAARNGVSSGKRTLSWIWTAGGGPDISEEGLLESVRIEWSKAKARRDRWHEEVTLLREEMRRVLQYLRSAASEWDAQATSLRALEDPVSMGRAAYAARQAYICETTGARFKHMWSSPISDHGCNSTGDPFRFLDTLPGDDPAFLTST